MNIKTHSLKILFANSVKDKESLEQDFLHYIVDYVPVFIKKVTLYESDDIIVGVRLHMPITRKDLIMGRGVSSFSSMIGCGCNFIALRIFDSELRLDFELA